MSLVPLKLCENLRNAEVAAAMGMMRPLTESGVRTGSNTGTQAASSATAAGFSAGIKTMQVDAIGAPIATGLF